MSTADSSRAPSRDRGEPNPVAAFAAAAAAAALAAGAAFAHRELILLRPDAALDVPLSADVESWFFEPSDTSPALVLLFVGWLLYRRRARLARAVGRPGSLVVTGVLFAAALGLFSWAVCTRAHDLQAISLCLEVLAAANAFGGRAALRVVLVPALVLLFALPMPAPLLNELVWKFQLWAAGYTGLLVHLLGQPALVSGDQIIRSGQVFQFIETCSGLRSAETLMLLVVLMVDLFRRSGVHALVLFLAALPISFVMNGLRALTLMFNPHSDIAAIHNLQGIVMLLGGVVLLYGLDGLLARYLPRRAAPAVELPPPGPSRRSRGAWLAMGAAVAALLALSVGLRPWPPPSLRPGSLSTSLGRELDGWRGTDVAPDRMFLGLANFSQILDRDYVRGRERVNAFVGVAGLALRYRSFRTPKTEVPATGWIVEERRHERRGERWVDVELVRKGALRLLVHHWRQGSLGLAGEALRSALALDWSPFRRSEIPLVVRLATPVSGGPADRRAAEERLEGFAELIIPILKEVGTPRGQ